VKEKGMDPIAARTRMIDMQLRARGIRDERVLQAFLTVPRHVFVEPAMHGSAYGDYALPIGHGQTISQPYMVAVMTEALHPEPDDRILEIGTGSGYQGAILASLVRTVFTIERISPLAQRAQQILSEIGIKNVIQMVGDGTMGWKQFAPFDGIIVTAGAPQVPESLRLQLADGARLVVPIGGAGSQVLRVITRRGDAFVEEDGVLCAFVPLIGREGWTGGAE
jgi:protein-L-isoaspartate(D-aspartate) O-methyltransferase